MPAESVWQYSLNFLPAHRIVEKPEPALQTQLVAAFVLFVSLKEQTGQGDDHQTQNNT